MPPVNLTALTKAFLEAHPDSQTPVDLVAFLNRHDPRPWGSQELASKIRALRQRIFDARPDCVFTDIPAGESFGVHAEANDIARFIKDLPCIPSQTATETFKQKVRAYIEALPAAHDVPRELPHVGQFIAAFNTSSKMVHSAMEELAAQNYVKQVGQIEINDTRYSTWVVAPEAPRRASNQDPQLNGLDPATHQLAEWITQGDERIAKIGQLTERSMAKLFNDEMPMGAARSQAVCTQLVALGLIAKKGSRFALPKPTQSKRPAKGLTATEYRTVVATFQEESADKGRTPELLAQALLPVLAGIPIGTPLHKPETARLWMERETMDGIPPQRQEITGAYRALLEQGAVESVEDKGKTVYQVSTPRSCEPSARKPT